VTDPAQVEHALAARAEGDREEGRPAVIFGVARKIAAED